MMQENRIRQYWNQRALECGGGPEATTNDRHLRELETRALIAELGRLPLNRPFKMLDVGCGDGLSTLRVAEAMEGGAFTGVDYAEEMIETAMKHLAAHHSMAGRVSFRAGDVLELGRIFGPATFDAVLTDRCLINLETFEDQKRGISQIAGCLKPGGHYIAVENFTEGQEGMNEARARLGLPEIPVRWHNLFFTEAKFREAAAPWFDGCRFLDFSSGYYFATRLVYSAMCRMRGEEPDYNHEIHRIAVDLPSVGMFSPIRMAILKRKGN